jgi:hypothetical protein
LSHWIKYVVAQDEIAIYLIGNNGEFEFVAEFYDLVQMGFRKDRTGWVRWIVYNNPTDSFRTVL